MAANDYGDTYMCPDLPQKIVARWLAHSAPDRWSKFYTSNLLNSHSSKTLTTDWEPSVQASGPQFFVVTLGTHRYHQTRWQTILKTFWKIIPLYSESLPSVHGLRYFQACARSFGNSTECINAL